MIGHMAIRSFAPKTPAHCSMSRGDHLRQNDNYLDEKIKTVTARQTEMLEVLWIKTLSYAVGQGLVVKPRAEVVECAAAWPAKPLKCLMGQNVKSPFSNIRAGTFKLHPCSSRIADANRTFNSRPAKSP